MFRRGWAGLGLMLAQLTALAGRLSPANARRIQRFALVAESLARRLLLAEALRRAQPALRPFTRKAREALARAAARRRLDPCDVRYRPPRERAPSLSFMESLPNHAVIGTAPARISATGPAIRSLDVGPMTVRVWSTDPRRNPKPPTSDEAGIEAAARNLSRRIGALQEVADNRARHIARMGRWLARAEMARDQDGQGRLLPLRPGLAPGQLRTVRAREQHHHLLADASFLVSRARGHWMVGTQGDSAETGEDGERLSLACGSRQAPMELSTVSKDGSGPQAASSNWKVGPDVALSKALATGSNVALVRPDRSGHSIQSRRHPVRPP